MSLKLEQILGGKKESLPKDWKLIGFHGSPQMSSDLNLIAIGMGLDKSKLLRKIVGDFILEHDPVRVMINKARELMMESVEAGTTHQEFKANLRAFLIEKKVAEDVVKQVLKAL